MMSIASLVTHPSVGESISRAAQLDSAEIGCPPGRSPALRVPSLGAATLSFCESEMPLEKRSAFPCVLFLEFG